MNMSTSKIKRNFRCSECRHWIREHDYKGKCRITIVKGEAKYRCDCKVNVNYYYDTVSELLKK